MAKAKKAEKAVKVVVEVKNVPAINPKYVRIKCAECEAAVPKKDFPYHCSKRHKWNHDQINRYMRIAERVIDAAQPSEGGSVK